MRVGDYVLAQDPDSGELAYKVVLAIAVPQELDVSNLDFADDSLHCAPGHVVWQSGAGWKRVAKVGESDTLHCVKNELRVDQADEAFRIDCYDLIVDDFHTFFAGESGVFGSRRHVDHPDLRSPPWIFPSAVAHATQLAASAK